MVVVRNVSLPMHLNPSAPQLLRRKKMPNLSALKSPTKKRRTTYEQNRKLAPKGLSTRAEHFLDTLPNLGNSWEAKWTSHSKLFFLEEIPLDTKLERRDHCITALGYMGKDFIRVGETDTLGPLATRQKYYRVEPQHQFSKNRARMLLDQTWSKVVDEMVEVFKHAMRCKNCGNYYLPDGVANVVGVLDEILRTKDPNVIGQPWLDDFREVARQSGRELLLEMMEKDPICRGTRKVWSRIPIDVRGRADSGVSIIADFEEKLKLGFKPSEQEIIEEDL